MLDLSTYIIRQHVGMFKLSDTYDILDARRSNQVGIAKEKVSGLVKLLRLLINKNHLPTTVDVYEGNSYENPDKLIFSIRRGISLFQPKVEIYDAQGMCAGWLLVKVFTIGRTFMIHDASGNQVGLVKGNWVGWEFRILDQQDRELGRISKKWAGFGKELLTSADNYVVDLGTNPGPGKAMLFLAAGLAIDTVFKEK